MIGKVIEIKPASRRECGSADNPGTPQGLRITSILWVID